MIGAAIYSILSGNSALVALVGTDADGDAKIYPVIVKQGASAPHISFLIKTIPTYFKNGVEADVSTITIDCFAKSYLAAENLAAAVRSALELKSGTYSNTKIIEMTVDSIDDDYYMDESESLNIKTITIKATHN